MRWRSQSNGEGDVPLSSSATGSGRCRFGAHEPVAESLLDSADRLGMLMWVENREFGQETDGCKSKSSRLFKTSQEKVRVADFHLHRHAR